MSSNQNISVQQLAELSINGEVDLIDVRTPVEYREIHASAARNIPLDRFDPNDILRSRSRDLARPLYVICKTGGRASKAIQKLSDAGFSNAINVEGGTDAWVAASLPVVRGKKAVSLERQVRIAAGSLAASGAFAALLTGNVLWAILPAFVGSGLIFAGISDICMMGNLLAKMPWNSAGQ